MILDFDPKKQYTQSIDIVDGGNTCLRCTTDESLDYYIITKTIMGKVHILTFGPIIPDVPILPQNFSVYYYNIDYKEDKLHKSLDKFINGGKCVTNVTEILEQDALRDFPDILELFSNLS